MKRLLESVMITNSALFFFGAVQHAGFAIGSFHEPRIIPAAIVETLCGLSLLCGARAVLIHSRAEWRVALIANLVALGGVLWVWPPSRQVSAHARPATTSTTASCWFCSASAFSSCSSGGQYCIQAETAASREPEGTAFGSKSLDAIPTIRFPQRTLRSFSKPDTRSFIHLTLALGRSLGLSEQCGRRPRPDLPLGLDAWFRRAH